MKSSKLILQLLAVLVVGLIGEVIMDKLFRVPMSIRSLSLQTSLWLFAGCCYLVPRYITPSTRYRILGSIILLGVLAAVRVLIAKHYQIPVPFLFINAPIPALATLCILGAVASPPRKLIPLVGIPCLSSIIYFICMSWSYGFRNYSFAITVVQLIPLAAVALALFITDNLLRRSEHSGEK